MNRPHFVVLGAGPGGLAASLQLACAGAKVTMLEARSRVGGRCSAIERDGFRFDVGPTFFLYPRVLQEIFRSLGRELFNEVPMVKLDPQYRIVFGQGGSLDCTPNLDQMESRIAELSPRDSGALQRFMANNRAKLARFRPILESPFDGPLDLLRPSVLAAAPHLKPWRSLGQELQSHFHDPRLAIAFSFQSKYLGMSPFRCPSLFSILSFLEYEYGVFHPIGGCSRVSERMGEIAKEMGVDVRLSEPVEELVFDQRRVVAVRTGQGTYPLDALVINADFARTMERLVPDRLRKRWNNRSLARKKYSCSTFMMYLGIRGRFPEIPHHQIRIATDYQKNLREIEVEGVLSDDPSFYLQNPCSTDPSLAPAGHSSLYILVPVPNLQTSKVTWTSETAHRFRNHLLDRLGQVGFGDLKKRIVFEQMLTPVDWEERFDVFRGATFNLAHGLDQMLYRRPHNRFEELDGVYLVGGGTHPGSGLPVIYESSRITCRQILRDYHLPFQFIDRHSTMESIA